MANLFLIILVWFLKVPLALQICTTVFCGLALIVRWITSADETDIDI